MESTEKTETVVVKETPKKQVKRDATKKRLVELDSKIEKLTKAVEANTERIESLPDFSAKIEALETSLEKINIDGLKSRLFDLETSTGKNISTFKEELKEFKVTFEKFQKIWGHNEEGLTVNDHFQGQNVEKPFIHGDKLVDEQGNEIIDKPKSKLHKQFLGDLEVLEVP